MKFLRNILIALLIVGVVAIGVMFFLYSSASHVYPDLDAQYDQEQFEVLSDNLEPNEDTDSLELTFTSDELRTLILGNLQGEEDDADYVSGLDVQLDEDAVNVRVNANLSMIRETLPSFVRFILRKDTVSFQVTALPQLREEEIQTEIKEFKIGKLGLPVGRLLALLEQPLSSVPQVNIAEGGRIISQNPEDMVKEISLDEDMFQLLLVKPEP